MTTIFCILLAIFFALFAFIIYSCLAMASKIEQQEREIAESYRHKESNQ